MMGFGKRGSGPTAPEVQKAKELPLTDQAALAAGAQASAAPATQQPPQPAAAPVSSVGTVAPTPAAQADSAVGEKLDVNAPPQVSDQVIERYTDSRLENKDYKTAKAILIETLLQKVDFSSIDSLSVKLKKEKISQSVDTIIADISLPLNGQQVELLKKQTIDEVLGFGPIEPLITDPDVSDILINTCNQIYVEKAGKIRLCDITFMSESHLMNVIQKIVSKVGRSVDEASPMVDARMPDGSRFNAIVPPLAIDGSLVSIRKFKKNKMPLSDYVAYGSMTQQMATFLEVCGSIRLNIMVSGGTGSGKTTMLNALSGFIGLDERVITIEDAAELQLHQPHVLRLETRPQNMEGTGEITQRALVKNALRMRPDRIILGEIRGEEIIDMLAAMNTGHEGSMATIHANNPRDCLARVENLVGMSGISLPIKSLRNQVASAINLIVQISRMRDGGRRVTHIEEIVGMEGDVITTQLLFGYEPGPMGDDGKLTGEFFYTGIKPRFAEKAMYYNLSKKLNSCFNMKTRAY